ncbi:MAG: hypothetical protein AAF253_05350 [Pseudomonadota bacterium]
MTQGTRKISRRGRGWMVGLVALSGFVAVIAMDVSQDGMEWQAGPLSIQMDVKADRGLAIRFQRFAPRNAPGFADTEPEARSLRG